MSGTLTKRIWLVLFLSACTTPYWDKAGGTPQEAEADLKRCEASAPLAPRAPSGPRTKPGSNTIDFGSASESRFDQARKDEQKVAECMRARGYVKKG